MDLRLDQTPVLAAFAAAACLIADVIGFYTGGSIAAGDIQSRISDLDPAAVIATHLDDRSREHLRELHEVTRREDPFAAKVALRPRS